jgi:hypothetical protein
MQTKEASVRDEKVEDAAETSLFLVGTRRFFQRGHKIFTY